MTLPNLLASCAFALIILSGLTSCGQNSTRFSSYKGLYTNETAGSFIELRADGTGRFGGEEVVWYVGDDSEPGFEKFDTGHIFVTFSKIIPGNNLHNGNPQCFFFPEANSELEKDYSKHSLFSSAYDAVAQRPRLVYWGRKKE